MTKKIDKEILYNLYFIENLNFKQITEKLSVSRQCIKDYFNKYGFKSRGVSLDLTKQKFGELTPIEIEKPSNNGNIWKCKCDCGNIKYANVRNLKYDKVQRCDICAEKYKNKAFYGELSGTIWSQIKLSRFRGRYKNKELEFNITQEYAWNLFLQQDRKCSLTGMELQFPVNRRSSNGTASLDRIDSKKGYIEGNVQWIHKVVNKMKMELNQEDFILWCHKISNYNKI